MIPIAENWGSLLPLNLLQYADELCVVCLLLLFLFASYSSFSAALNSGTTAVAANGASNHSGNGGRSGLNEETGWWDNLKHCSHRKLVLAPQCARRAMSSRLFQDTNTIIVEPANVDSNATPLLCFVNSKSGGNQGDWIRYQLRRLLNPVQVIDLAQQGPGEALKLFVKLPGLRVLVCGGDGTVGWVLSEIDKLDPRERPPLAILPLGTGNDLARVLGWGRGYNNSESLLNVLNDVQMSHVVMMDRWQLQCMHNGKEQKKVIFNNYFGIGVDAQVALRFHHLREEQPEQFWSRIINKCWYLYLGAQEMFRRSFVDFTNNVELKADGKVIPLPPGTQGIIFLNINSYGGGVRLWHDDDCEDGADLHFEEPVIDITDHDDFSTTASTEYDKPRRRGSRKRRNKNASYHHYHHTDGSRPVSRATSQQDLAELAYASFQEQQKWYPSSMFDGLLEVVAVTGTFHLGQLQVGLSKAHRVVQCREAVVKCKRSMPVQADGEPWGQGKCEMKISATPSRAYMLRQTQDDGAAVLSEVSQVLAWGERTDIISTEQKNKLLLEFSRRLECLDEGKRKSNDFELDTPSLEGGAMFMDGITSFLSL